MKLVFVTSYPFTPLENKVYAEGQFSCGYWEKYLEFFETIVVVSPKRAAHSKVDLNKLTLSSHEKVSFVFTPNLSTLSGYISTRKLARKILSQELSNANALVTRFPSDLCYLASMIAIRMNKPWIAELAGCAWDGLWNYGNLQGKLYAPLQYFQTRQAISLAPFIIYVTNNFLQNRYPNRSGVQISCLDIAMKPPQKDVLTAKIERIISSPVSSIVFGLIGTFKGRFKGIQTVFYALKTVKQSLPNVSFRIIGSGDPSPWQKEAYNNDIADIVFFDGLLPPDQVLPWLDGIDIYLQPSFKEGLPRALIEAMSRGCPALGSTCAGIPELLSDDCLIRPGDHKSLARLMIKAANDKNWQVEQATRNWKVSCGYSQDILNERRRVFLSQFRDYVLESSR